MCVFADRTISARILVRNQTQIVKVKPIMTVPSKETTCPIQMMRNAVIPVGPILFDPVLAGLEFFCSCPNIIFTIQLSSDCLDDTYIFRQNIYIKLLF